MSGVMASELDRGGSATGRMAWSSDDKDDGPLSTGESPKKKKGICAGGCLAGMWVTRQLTDKSDKEGYIKTTLRELVIYLMFLFIFCMVTLGMVSTSMYNFTQAMEDLYLDTPYEQDTWNSYRGSTQLLDFWRFYSMVLMDGMYFESWYNDDETPTDPDDNNVAYQNRILGVARMRQIQVRNDSCEVPDDFSKVIRQCFAVYSSSYEDKNNFGAWNTSQYPTAWRYYSENELGGYSYWGMLATYSGAGNYVDFFLNEDDTKAMINSIKQDLWITRGTRVVFIDFTLYNANLNLFCVLKFIVEFPATGGIIPSFDFKTVKLLRYVTPWDYFILGCEFIFLFFIIYYIIEEIVEIVTLKCAYFNTMWSILDLLVILMSLVCYGFNFYCLLTIGKLLDEVLRAGNEGKFVDFGYIAYWQWQFNRYIAICLFFAWFKLFKYISFNKTMTQLFSTLSRCSKDIVGFAIMFFIVFFAFAQLGYLLFGTQVEDFSGFVTSLFTLLRVILGDFNFHDIEEANRILGPIYFLSYVFFVFFVLLNMFLAIINDTYIEVKAEIASQKNEFEIGDYFRQGFVNVKGKFGVEDRRMDIENSLKTSDRNQDGMLSFSEVRTSLKSCNFSDMEIEVFFAKYDVDRNKLIEMDEIKLMLDDLSGRNGKEGFTKYTQSESAEERPISARSAQITGETASRPPSGNARPSSGRVQQDEFVVQCRRVDHMEQSIGSIVSKIDIVLMKMDAMDKTKTKRKEQMNKMLDDIMEDKDIDDHERKSRMEKLVSQGHEQGNGGALKTPEAKSIGKSLGK